MTKQERSWILYDWANSAYSLTVTTAIFPIFFKNVVAKGVEGYTSTGWLGYGNSFYTLLIALTAPILGTIADYRNNKKRLFFTFFILGVIATALLASVRERQWINAIIIYVVSAIGFAGANIFYDALIVDVTSRERMDWISSSGFAWGYIGSTIPFILGLFVVLQYGKFGFQNPSQATRVTFIITALWWGFFTIPLLKNVKQIYFLEPSSHPIKESFIRIIHTFKRIHQYRNAFLFLLAYFFYIDGVDTIIKMATAFGTDVGISSNMLLIIVLAVQIVAFPFALVYGKLARIFSAKKMLLTGILVYIIITITAFFIPRMESNEIRIKMFWVLSMLVASSQGGIQALSRSFYSKLIPKNESAEFFGFYNIFGKFAAILGPFLMGFATQITRSSSSLFLIGGFVLIRTEEEP